MQAIVAQGIGKSFQGRRACWDLSFEVARGEVFGLLGPNGAGKTTTLRILAGLTAPDAGRAVVAGHEIAAGRAGPPELRRKVGLLTEAPGFYDRLTARENLVYFGRLYGLAAHEADARARVLLGRFTLASHQGRPFAELSRGMKQKLAIARALLHEPEVIFLDEPTVGLDPEATREVRAVVEELAAEKRTIVLCTHHLDEVERLCARAAFIAGRLLAVHEVRPLAALPRVRLLLAQPHAPAAAALRALDFVSKLHEEGATLLLELSPGGSVPDAVACAVAAGARIEEVHQLRDPLEEAWVSLLDQARREGLAA